MFPEEDEQVPALDKVYESAELDLVISESSGSANKERVDPSPHPPVASSHHSPSRSKLIQSNHEERNNFNISHQSGSQNLLASESDVVPSTYTLSQAVNNLEDIPVVEPEKENINSEERGGCSWA